jgi:UDP-N-acetylmuramate--alanine ligase
VSYVPRIKDVPKHLAGIVEDGDLVITMGAGDIWTTARAFVEMLEKGGRGG